MTAPVQLQQHRQTEHARTTVCGIIGAVFGAIGLVLSFIPIINNIAAVFGAVGLVLAIIGIVGTFRGKKHGKVLAIVAAVLSVLAIVITLSMQSAASNAIDQAVKDAKGVDSSQSATTPKSDDASGKTDTDTGSGEQDTEGDIEGAHVKIVSAVKSNADYEGKSTVLVTYDWTNTASKNNSFMSLAMPKVFQNGAELQMAVYMDNPEGYDANSYMKEVQPGAHTTVTIGYVLQDDSPVTLDVTGMMSMNDDMKVTHTFMVQ